MKTYIGVRTASGDCKVQVREAGVRTYPLPLRLEIFNHSPTGFEWGYGGSGPAQLALAILVDHFSKTENIMTTLTPEDQERAVRLHQDFKARVVAGMPHEGFQLTGDQVERIVKELEGKFQPTKLVPTND